MIHEQRMNRILFFEKERYKIAFLHYLELCKMPESDSSLKKKSN
jgi:hypothetical protein